MRDENTYRMLVLTAAVSGVFSVVVCALLLYDYMRRGPINPSENLILQALKSDSAKQPENEELKSKIRTLDLQLRQEYYRQRTFSLVGAGLLLGGVVVFLVSLKTAANLRRELPHPQPVSAFIDLESRWTRIGRWAVAVFALGLAGIAIVLSLAMRSNIPNLQKITEIARDGRTIGGVAEGTGAGKAEPVAALTEALPTEEEYAQAWPRFRGPGGRGISAYTNTPTEWDAASGKNIPWKTPVPLPGNSSPVVWKDRVFLTGADEKRREVYCFDATSGKMLWQKDAPGTPQSTSTAPKVNDDTGFAASTPATDGRRVFAIFANGDLAAYDFGGNLAWSKSLGIPENAYGHASSLATYKNMLFVQFDQGASAKAGRSKLLAFDSATGKPVWETDRPVGNSWPSPIVIRTASGDQIVTAADPWVIAYDPENGREIWRAKCLQQDVGPSPTFAAGKVFVANESPALSAIRVDGQGDVTASHIVWKGEDNLPDVCSPLACDQFVFLLASYGTLTCYDAEKGEQLWAEDFDADFTSSPSMAGKLVYVFAKNGKAWVVEPERDKCRRVAECNIGERCVTCPAFQDGRIYIRGKTNLICIGQK
jgi:outer membrane protein assembly factor BamB